MKNLINEIIFNLKRSQTIVIIGIVTFIVGLLLGIFITLPDEIFEIHNTHLFCYYNEIFCAEKVGLSLLFRRIINTALLLLLVFLLSLNKFTFYLNFVVLFYRAFVLGVACRLFITQILITGAIMFVFLILIQALFISLAIIVFMSIIYCRNDKIDDCTLKLMVKSYIVSLIIAVIGCIIEFAFIIMLFRPLNLYF